MALITASQPKSVLDHDEIKSPALPDSIFETPNTGTTSPAKHPSAQVMPHDQEGPCIATSMSLNAAMRADCRRRFYVHPIAWTQHHLELLGVCFDRARPLSCQGMGDSQAGSDVKDEANLVTGLPWDTQHSHYPTERLKGSGAELQNRAMEDLLYDFGLTRSRYQDMIVMQFRGKAVCYLGLQGLWYAKTGDQMMISINFSTISEARHHFVHGVSRRPGRNHSAGLALKRHLEKALQPSRADRDPYIWALLIALAQAQKKLAPDASRWKVLLLAVPGPGARQLYFYQGWVPAPLLRKLDEPSAEVACPTVAIQVRTISLEAPRDATRCVWEMLHEAEFL